MHDASSEPYYCSSAKDSLVSVMQLMVTVQELILMVKDFNCLQQSLLVASLDFSLAELCSVMPILFFVFDAGKFRRTGNCYAF